MFFYIPVSPEHMAASARLQELHRILAYLYQPIWKLDSRIWRGPMAAGIPLQVLKDAKIKIPILHNQLQLQYPLVNVEEPRV